MSFKESNTVNRLILEAATPLGNGESDSMLRYARMLHKWSWHNEHV
jgi:hypothetical protein